MPSVQLNPKVTTNFNEIIAGISNLELADLELFLKEVATVVAQKKAPSLSEMEAGLFLKINEPFSVKLQKKYEQLSKKMKDKKLNEKEHSELQSIIKKWETFDVERMKNIVLLAQIRKTPLREFMNKHGLISPPNVQ